MSKEIFNKTKYLNIYQSILRKRELESFMKNMEDGLVAEKVGLPSLETGRQRYCVVSNINPKIVYYVDDRFIDIIEEKPTSDSKNKQMSKELEALNYLVNLAVEGNKENHRGKIFDSEEIVLKALKRKEPMKPIKDKENYRCARCAHLVDNHYCSECGQAIDWSDEK